MLVGWFMCLFFRVNVIDSAYHCRVVQVICCDFDAIHKHSCGAGLGCWLFSCYVGCCVKLLRYSQGAMYTYYILQRI